jgi:hypothetical protein
MSKIRYWVLSFASFVVTIAGSLLVPGSFMNRGWAVICCTFLSFNSAICSSDFALTSDIAFARGSSQISYRNTSQPKRSEPYHQKELNADNYIAFKAKPEVHGDIVESSINALQGIQDKNGELLKFTAKAVDNIKAAAKESRKNKLNT